MATQWKEGTVAMLSGRRHLKFCSSDQSAVSDNIMNMFFNQIQTLMISKD